MPNLIKNGFVVRSESAVLIPDTMEDDKLSRLEEESLGGEVETIGPPAMEEDPLERLRAEEEERLRQKRREGESLVQQAQTEAEQLRKGALAEGRAEGIREKRAEIEDCLARVNTLTQSMEISMQRFFAEYEEELKKLSLAVAGKILERRITMDDMELAELVKKAVVSVKKADWIQVEVSEQLPLLVEYLQRELSQPEYGGNIEVEAKHTPPGTCVIQTPDGVIDASVSTQLENLNDCFNQADQ